MKKKPSPSPAAGAIASGQVYPLEEFKRITGLGEAAMRSARRQGLRVSYVGGRGFVRGDDFAKFLDTVEKN